MPSPGARGRIGIVLALFVVVAIAVVAGVAVLVARDRPLITDDPVGSRALAWPPGAEVDPQDLAEVRFAVALRGYRMDEVDRVLDDTREALAGRDARIAELQRVVAALGGSPGALEGEYSATIPEASATVAAATEAPATVPEGPTGPEATAAPGAAMSVTAQGESA